MTKQWPKPPAGWPFSGEGDPAHDTSVFNRNVKVTHRDFIASERRWGALTYYVQHPPEDAQNSPDDRTIDGEWKDIG